MRHASFISLPFIALSVLAACVPIKGREPNAAELAPKGPQVRIDEARVIHVTGTIADEDALAPIHCTAAKAAWAEGYSAIEWVGGIAEPKAGGGFVANMAYETTLDKMLRFLNEGVKPEDGGMVATKSWLSYCDEAGIPREGGV